MEDGEECSTQSSSPPKPKKQKLHLDATEGKFVYTLYILNFLEMCNNNINYQFQTVY